MRFLVQLVVLGMLCLLVGCAPKITVQVLSNGKLMTYVPKGTTINWIDENNNAVTVTFPYANPCAQNSSSPTCVVKNGQGIYQCKDSVCLDPGIGVKPTTKPMVRTDAVSSVPKGSSVLYEVFCDDQGTAKADGPVVHYQDGISWVPSVVNKNDFTLTGFDPAGVCTPSTIVKGVVCTVSMNTTVDATYQVNYPACMHPAGTGKLHIKMQ